MTHRLPSSNCIDIQFSSPSIQVFTSNIQYSNIISSTQQSYYTYEHIGINIYCYDQRKCVQHSTEELKWNGPAEMLSKTTRYIIHNPFNNHQPPTSNHIKSIQNALTKSVPRFCWGTQGTWFLMEFILVLDFRLPWHLPLPKYNHKHKHTLISKHHNILHQIYCSTQEHNHISVGLRD